MWLRRWFNHLCPDVKKGSWTADEDRVIMESVREFGTRWSHIVKLMPGRTDNAIKNRCGTWFGSGGGGGDAASVCSVCSAGRDGWCRGGDAAPPLRLRRYNSAMRRAKRLQRLHEASGDAEATPPHITPELLMPKPKAKPPASPGGDNTPGKKAKRKRESQENTTANFGADDVPPQLTSADDEPSMAVSDGGEGVAVVINAGSLASLGLGMGKTDEEEGKAKGAKKRRPSRARSKGAQGAGSISSGSVLDENLQGPGGAAGLSPQHLAQLAQMLKAGGENAPANQSELLELLASQMPSPLGGTLGSPMQAVLEAGLLAHGNRDDGSPFDFNAALQDLSPGTFGAASALPQLISASPMPAPPAELRGAAEAAGKLAAAAEAAGKQRGKAAAKATPQKAGACAGAAGGGEGSSGERRLSGASPAGASPAGVSPGSLFAMLDGLDDRALCGELKAGDQAELKVGTPSLLMPPPPPPPPRNTPATKTDPSSGLRVSSSDDWMSAYNSNSKASPPQMLLSEQLSPVHSPHLTDFLTTGF